MTAHQIAARIVGALDQLAQALDLACGDPEIDNVVDALTELLELYDLDVPMPHTLAGPLLAAGPNHPSEDR